MLDRQLSAPCGERDRLASLLLGGLLAAALGIRAVYYLGGALLVTAANRGLAGCQRCPRRLNWR